MKTKPEDRIQPYVGNPRYWQFRGEPVLLLGGSVTDHLFQIPDLEEHLDDMVSVGANYVRNTMSDRGDESVRAFARTADGLYDLSRWNDEYWERFSSFLTKTSERDIIVQIELWDQWDHNGSRWNENPWNPAWNVNYTPADTHLRSGQEYENVKQDSGIAHDFFLTIPTANNDAVVLNYQRNFIDKVLAIALPYPNVVYTITNELFLQHPIAWSRYWAEYLQQKAREAGVVAQITEMFHTPSMSHPQYNEIFDNQDLYSYVDISQNSMNKDDVHWSNLMWTRDRLAGSPRPINHTKTYGADGEFAWWAGPTQQAVQRFWRNVIGGAASMRFHRPTAGIGLNATAQACIKAGRMLDSIVNIWEFTPSLEILVEREPNQAYATSKPGEAYIVYFTNGGRVGLDLTQAPGQYSVRWIDGSNHAFIDGTTVSGGAIAFLTAPCDGPSLAVVQRCGTA